MPYKIYKNKNNTFRVVNTKNKKVKAKHTTYENALKQIRLLHMVEYNKNYKLRNKTKNKMIKNNNKTKKNKK